MPTRDTTKSATIRMASAVRKVWAHLRALRDNRSGISLVTTALMLPVLVGSIGLALDIGVWQVNKRNLQGAVDQAVYSAAVASTKGATVDQAQVEAKGVMAQLGFVDGTDGVTVTVSNPPTTGSYNGNASAWQVVARKSQTLLFSRVLMNSAPMISVRAVALNGSVTTTAATSSTRAGKGCILTLDTTGQYATEITNNGASSNANCEIYTNSNNAKALACYNNCAIAGDTFTVGGVYKSGTMTGTNKTGQAAVADPYSSITAPTQAEMGATCANGNKVVKSTTAASLTINPGRYCKGINFTGAGKTLVMNAGTYYVESIFMVGNGATLNATASPGVTIVIVGSYCLGDTNNTCQHPDEGIGNTANINITAPTTGTYAGIAMYFSDTTLRQHPFANSAYLHIQGVLYAPHQKLAFNNNSYFDNTKCTKVVSFQVTINNNGNMSADCTGLGVKSIGDVTTLTPGVTTTTASKMVE